MFTERYKKGVVELFKSVLIKMDFDEVCFQRSETEDYNVEDLVKQPDSVVKHLIEYRVKVLLKKDIVVYPGEEILTNTACIIKNGIQDCCMHILKNEKIPLILTSEGYISELFNGRVVVKLANYKNETIKLSGGTEIAYIILNTFSLN